MFQRILHTVRPDLYPFFDTVTSIFDLTILILISPSQPRLASSQVSRTGHENLTFKYCRSFCTVSFHIGVFCFDARQFGAFHFGDFHFDAVPVRRVSLWRASTSARFSFARFHFGAFLFGAFPNFVRTYDDPVSANASFARTVSFLRRNAFYASLARIGGFILPTASSALSRLSNARESVSGVPVYTSHAGISARQCAPESVARRHMLQSSTVLNFRASRQQFSQSCTGVKN